MAREMAYMESFQRLVRAMQRIKHSSMIASDGGSIHNGAREGLPEEVAHEQGLNDTKEPALRRLKGE